MDRISKILNHQLYKNAVSRLSEFEKDRIFCNHTMEHFIDVARIMYIMNLEENSNLNKELIYATALTHDLGRVKQYEDGIPHHIAGHDLITNILSDCDFTESEIKQMLSAIEHHRDGESENKLSVYLYKADKKSRNCFSCKASEECNWSEEKKNKGITI